MASQSTGPSKYPNKVTNGMRWRGLVSKVGSREGGADEYEAGGICMPTLFGLGRG
jgi:hypothetical protein